MKAFLRTTLFVPMACFVSLGLNAPVVAADPVSPAALKAMLGADSPPLVVDVRHAQRYQQGSIPGAINIPASFLATRSFPTGRDLVLFDDGFGTGEARSGAGALSARLGRPVYWLEGGFAAWMEEGGAHTAASGMRPEALPRLTYRQLSEADLSGAVLFDLRDSEEPEPGTMAPAGAVDDEVAAFARGRGVPLMRGSPLNVLQSPRSASGTLAPAASRPLVVLIDDNDGKAEEMARKLRANGLHRVVILTGGAEIIRHEGRSGTVRRSTGIRMEMGPEDERP